MSAALLTAQATGGAAEILVVRSGPETFGIPVGAVRGVFRIDRLTRVPQAPRAFVGLVNVRGTIVPIFSLGACLGTNTETTIVGGPAVNLDTDGEAALLVDSVGDVVTLDADSRIDAPPHVSAERAVFLAALYRLNASLLPILDVRALFRLMADFPPR